MTLVRLSAQRTGCLYPPPPGDIPGTHSCKKLSRPQGHKCSRKVLVNKENPNDSIENQTRDLPTCSAVPQPTAPQRTPHKHAQEKKSNIKFMELYLSVSL